MTDYLRERARPGDAMSLTGPFGHFYLRRSNRPILMVAGGTGLAPMLSMLDHMAATGMTAQPVHLLYGGNAPEELFALDQLAEYPRRGLRLSTECIAVTAGAGWSGPRGHVTELLRPELVAGESEVYLCGPPPMIDAGMRWLEAHSVPPRRIHAERFLAS
jgi:NAD(P)H-flavin reductase